MTLGKKGSGRIIGLEGDIESSSMFVDDKLANTWKIDLANAVLVREDAEPTPLNDGRVIQYKYDQLLKARDAMYTIFGVDEAEPEQFENHRVFFAASTRQVKNRATGESREFTDFFPEKLVGATDEQSAERLTSEEVVELLVGKTPRDAMALSDTPGIKGTDWRNVVRVKSAAVELLGLTIGEDGTYQRAEVA